MVKEESKIEAEKGGQRKADGHGLDAGILTDRLNKSAAVQVKLTGNETDLANYSQVGRRRNNLDESFPKRLPFETKI